MKLIEILCFNKELLRRLSAAGVRPDDYKYVDMYRDFKKRRNQGEKVAYIVKTLSDKYQVSERFVYSTIARLDRDFTANSMQ